MSALTKIKNAGFAVKLEGDSFKIIPSSKLTTTQRDFLKSHKAEILTELKNENNSAVVSCGKCQHFKSHNEHGRGAGYCLIGGAYGLWSESTHQCTQYDAAVKCVEMPDPKPDALTVICYTPNGKPIKVQARNEAHAAYLIRMNPKQEIK
ncbi:MAG: hypothetical protein WCS87_07050 [Methylococcaceae bacterium]